MSGYEMEFTLVDDRGDVSNRSEEIINTCKEINKNFPISKEVGKNMIEIAALPSTKIQKTALYFIDNIQNVQTICAEKGLSLLPLGTYPGSFKEKVWKKKRYIYPAKVIGDKKYWYYYSHCYGFHYHYSLPKGMFDHKNKFLNVHIKSRIKKTLIDSYNLLIAADPALTTFTQSSPFESGKYYAKDTRVLFLRGGKKLKFDGLYSNMQLMGGLPPYKQTLSDLISTLNKKDKRFKKMLIKKGAPKSLIMEKDTLDFVWNPVKINRLGTIEQRGMDTNHLNICLGASVMIKFILRAIQQEFYHVIPSDVGLKEPFKLEGNVIFIPPHTHVRNVLQRKSSYSGLADNEVYNVCNRFYKLARKLVYKNYLPTLNAIRDMIDTRKTVSDMIVNYVKRKGYSTDSVIPREISRQIALLHVKKMNRDIEKTKKLYEDIV